MPRAVLCPPHRKCKLVTSGPWLEVPPIALRDVSIVPESPAGQSGPSVALWAVSDKGDVLCRLGVSELNPAVSARPAGRPRNRALAEESGEAWPAGGPEPGMGLA